MQPAENVKAGVVERGNGMKYADAYGFHRRMILYENQKAQQRARTLEAQCHEQNGFDKPYDAFSVFHIHGFTHQ